jgi:hypothetical protein
VNKHGGVPSSSGKPYMVKSASMNQMVQKMYQTAVFGHNWFTCNIFVICLKKFQFFCVFWCKAKANGNIVNSQMTNLQFFLFCQTLQFVPKNFIGI